MFLGVVRAFHDEFRRSVSRYGVVELVLHHGVEFPRYRGVRIVIDGAFGENVRDLLPDAAFIGADGTDTLQQFAEIVFAEGRLPLLQSFIIQDKALSHIFFQYAGRPDPELRRPPRIHAVSH